MTVTIFESLHSKEPHYVSADKALARITEGKSRVKVEEIRAAIDKAKSNSLKRSLPAVVWSGKLTARGDKNLVEHSGLLVLDFDKLDDVGEKMATLQGFPSTYAAWVSPSGNGVKALIRIADTTKHREHFAAIRELWPDVDQSGANEERLCFESYDPHLFFNPKAAPYTTFVVQKQVTERQTVEQSEVFQRLLKWAAGRIGAFASGSRNTFVWKLAGACCRFGIEREEAASFIGGHFPTSSDFDYSEMLTAVKSAYRKNAPVFGSCVFEKDRLVDVRSRKEVKLEDYAADLDPTTRPRDVIYASDVAEAAMRIFQHGYEAVKGIGIIDVDSRWKPKPGELTCLTGIGNYGKSAFFKWYQLMRVLLYGERFATFSPEDNPPEEYYIDFVEMLLGCVCTPDNPNCPPIEVRKAAYDWVGQHIFYIMPENNIPTPSYIKERFLEMIVKEGVTMVGIDPFNQLSAEDEGARTDQYLSGVLTEFHRFAQANSVPFFIVAHPKVLVKDASKNYPCPDVFDLNGGAMWNNKMDNILAYHRPFRQTLPDDPTAEFHSKKVRRQKTVGRPGMSEMRYIAVKRRFEFGSEDPIENALMSRGINFMQQSAPIIPAQQVQPIAYTLPDDFWND